MGVLDAARRIFSGSGTRTLPVTLEPGELEEARCVASYRPGTLTSVGGDLVLTSRRLVFTPLDTRDVVEVLTWGLGKAGAPEFGTQLPGRLGDMIRQEQIRGVTAVDAGTDGSLLKPPTIRITGTDGSAIEIGLLAGRRNRNNDPANRRARDDMLAAIRGHLL